MRLIAEQITKAEFILEDRKGGGKNYFIEGVFLQAELKNKNGRMYPFKTLQREVAKYCLLYTSPSPRDRTRSRMPSSA